MSIPLCVLPHLLPNLDVTTPDVGLIKEIPKFTFLLEEFTPVAATAYEVCFTTFFTYKSATHFSTVENSFNSVSYFSTIDKLSLLLLSLFYMLIMINKM